MIPGRWNPLRHRASGHSRHAGEPAIFPRMDHNDQQTLACIGPPDVPAAPACVVVIHGEGFGLRADIRDEPVVIGRSSDATLCIRSPSVSRQHCEIRRVGDSYIVRDLGSTNATRVGDRAVQEATLADGDQITVGETILKFISHSNVEALYHERVSRLLLRDRLTGLLGRQDFIGAAEERIAGSKASASALSLALLDIADLTDIQLEHGDAAGDAVLTHVARLVSAQLDPGDLAARIGESRFAILLDGRDLEATRRLISLLEQQLAAPLELAGHAPLAVSIDSGAAQLTPGTGSLGQLIKQIRVAPRSAPAPAEG